MDVVEEQALQAHHFAKTVLESPFAPYSADPDYKASPKQALALIVRQREVFYGGAAGGGKSDWLLVSAQQFWNIPGYAALILRRTYPDLSQPGAIMDRSHLWWDRGGICKGAGMAKFDREKKTWQFPASLTATVSGPYYAGMKLGGVLKFGHLEAENEKYQFRGSEYQFIGFDELTDFTESQFRFLFSRLRAKRGLDVPLRMRAASNPGGPGHDWVYRRMILGSDGNPKRRFIPANLYDNPGLNAEEYRESLEELSEVEKLQLLEGNWTVKVAGKRFQRDYFEIVSRLAVPPGAWSSRLRYWDMAATDPKMTKGKKDPDYTAGVLLGQHEGIYYVFNVARDRTTPEGVAELIKSTSANDGREVSVFMEEEGGASGKTAVDYYQRIVLKGYDVEGIRATGSKEVRANPVITAAKAGNVKIVDMGPGQRDWIEPFLDELVAFGAKNDAGKALWPHDDQVDALSGAFAQAVTDEPLPSGLLLPGMEGTSTWNLPLGLALTDDPEQALAARNRLWLPF